MDKEQALKCASEYAQEVLRFMQPEQIFLFGSYAKNDAHPESDIDIAVIYNGFKGNWLQTSVNLWNLTRGISAYIEPILLDSASDRSGFVSEVFRTGTRIYPAPLA